MVSEKILKQAEGRKIEFKETLPKKIKSQKAANTDDCGRLQMITDDCGRLTEKERKILIYLLDKKTITRKKAVEILNVPKTKAHEVLSLLVDKNLIERKGKGRSTYYVLKKDEG